MAGVGLANRLGGNSSTLPVGIGDSAGGGIVTPSRINRLNFNLPVLSPGAGSFAATILGANYILDMELSALESEDRGELLSSPKVITADQQEAVIKQGQEVGYVTIQSSGTGIPTATVAFKEIVLELLVTPRITADGRVFLALKVKKDNLAGFIATPGGQVPIIDKREVQTGALVDNGQRWHVRAYDRANARFADFVRGPRAILAYLQGGAPTIGHNPLGALAVLAMLALVLAQAVSGLFSNDEIEWFGPLSERISVAASADWTDWHHLGQKLLLGLIVLHLLAIAGYKLVRRVDLVTPMLSGHKQVEQGADAHWRSPWLALVLFLVCAAAVAAVAVYGPLPAAY